MDYKILVLDIDGTLRNSKKEITKKTREAIIDLQEKGIKVVIASGRPTKGIEETAKELELKKYGGYILAFNGGKIIDCKTNEIIYKEDISKDLIPLIFDISKEKNVDIISYAFNEEIITENPDNEFANIESRIIGIPIKKVESFKDYIDFDVPKCIMLREGEYLATIEQDVREKLDMLTVFRSEPYFLEIVPKGIDKAKSLSKLLEKLNISKDEMVACGDGFNDLSMIKYAGMGVAMANAQDCIKEVADYITLSNDEDGIVDVINRFFN